MKTDSPDSRPVIRVLLIEDDDDDRSLLAAIPQIRKHGIDFEHVARLSEGLERLAEDGIDVVLLDLGVPDGDGLQAISKIRARDSDMPLVISTCHDDDDLAMRAVQQGADDCLVKSRINVEVVARVIRYAVERHRSKIDSEARQREIIRKNADGIVIVNHDGIVRFVNPAAEVLFGRTQEELLGSPFGFPLLSGETKEIELPWSDETQVAVELRVVALDWEGQQAYLASLRDISDRKRLEEQLRHAQRLESVGHLAGGVAHEFNNLLTAILGFGRMALDDSPPESPIRHPLEQILRAGDRASTLTRQLLAFSRRQMLQNEVTSLLDVVRQIVGLLQQTIGEDITIHLELAEDLNLIQADASQVEQVILNLAVNARDAMSDGGELIIRTRNVTLDRTYTNDHDYAEPGEYVELNIVDNGCGMPAEVARQAFDPFFTTKEVGKGTGLGLSTVYGIVKQLGGYIDLFSEPGEGTIFTMYFPKFCGDAMPEEAEEEKVDALPAGSETVLIVEDEPEVRQLLVIWLKDAGYDIIEAAHGYEAIEKSQAFEGSIDLLITDVVMPQMNGVQVADELARSRPDMKVLYVSGFNEERIMQHGVIDEDVHLLLKPIYRDTLAQKVREVLDLR